MSFLSGYKILSFRLDCCLNKSVTAPFEQCISSLGRLGVEELFLKCCCFEFRYNSDYSFSCDRLSKMPSLKYLELSKCFLQPTLTSQANVIIPSKLLCFVCYSYPRFSGLRFVQLFEAQLVHDY
ncbi:hypothetical protein ACP275_14G311200 [Erythranthe tilingii]